MIKKSLFENGVEIARVERNKGKNKYYIADGDVLCQVDSRRFWANVKNLGELAHETWDDEFKQDFCEIIKLYILED